MSTTVIDVAASLNVFATTQDISIDLGTGADRALLVSLLSHGDAAVSGGVAITSVVIDPGGAAVAVPLEAEYNLPSPSLGTSQARSRQGALVGGSLPTGVQTVRVTCANANTRPTIWAASLSNVTAVGASVVSMATGTTPSVSVPSAAGRTCFGMFMGLDVAPATPPTTLVEAVGAVTNRTVLGSFLARDSSGASAALAATFPASTAYLAVGWSLTGVTPPSELTGVAQLDDSAPSGSLADGGASVVSGSAQLADAAPSGLLGAAPGSITTNVWKNAAGAALPSQAVPVVTFQRVSDGFQALILLNQVTSASPTAPTLNVSHGNLVPGTWYMVSAWNADGSVYGIEPYQAV